MYFDLSKVLPRYERFHPKVPVYCVIPNLDKTIHRSFDASQFSQSGHYLGVTRITFEDNLPSPGDVAKLLIFDLATSEECILAEIKGLQWGNSIRRNQGD